MKSIGTGHFVCDFLIYYYFIGEVAMISVKIMINYQPVIINGHINPVSFYN